MIRLYLSMNFIAVLAFSVLMLIVSAVGSLFESDELAFAHCDERRGHCDLSFLDIEHGIIAAHRLEGTPFHLEWSPEGSRMVISQITMDGLWTYLFDTDGSIRRFQPLVFATTWLSEDRLMIQTTLTEFQVYNFVDAAFEPTIYTISESYNEVFFAQLSPDGQYYAVNSPMAFQQLNILPVTLMDDDREVLQINGLVSDRDFNWSPDNQEIIYSLKNLDNFDIYVTTLATGETRQLTSSATYEAYARWSHGGHRIAFVSIDTTSQYQLNILDESGTIHHLDLTSRLQLQVVSTLDWSADDRYLILQLYLIDGVADLYLITTDGTDIIRRLTYTENNYFPAWRP